MNISPLDIYLIMKADDLIYVIGALAIISFVIAIDLKEFKPFILGFVLSIIFLILPSTKQLIAMYIVPKLAQSDFVKTIPNEMQLYINKQLMNYHEGE